jgi:SOS response regulatory protein OraA/RecX
MISQRESRSLINYGSTKNYQNYWIEGRKQNCLKDQSQTDGCNKYAMRAVGRYEYFRNEMRGYLNAKPMNFQQALRMRILDTYRGVNEFKQ